MGQVLDADQKRTFRNIGEIHELGIVASCLQPGETGVEHSHTLVEETTIVRSGRGRIQIENDHYPLSPGSVAVIPAGEFHAITNDGNEPLEMVTVFNANVDRDAVILKNREEHFGSAGESEIAALTAAVRELSREVAALRSTRSAHFSPPRR